MFNCWKILMDSWKNQNLLDLSDDFWERFNVQNKKLKKQVGLYEIENIDNVNILTLAINPK